MPLGNPIQKNNDSRIVSATATAGQTQFTISGGYIVNNISVFRNGVRLSNADDFTASDGSTVNLNTAADVGDTLDFHVWSRFTVSDAIIGAASTQAINGNLNVAGSLYADTFRPSNIITDGNANLGSLNVSGISTLGIATVSAIGLDLTGTANISGIASVGAAITMYGSSGIVSATSFYGDGSNLSGIDATTVKDSNGVTRLSGTTSGVVISGTTSGSSVVGVATFQNGLDITGNIVNGLNVSAGIATIAGDVSIADKIIHTGDTDTAIRFSGADTISFETGGSARAFINSAGDLTVGGSAGTLGKVYIRQASDTDTEGLALLNGGGSNSFKLFLGDTAGTVAHLGHGGQKQINITQAGKTGIGITNPGAELHAYHATSNTIAQFESGDAGAGVVLKDNSTYSSIEQNGTDFIISADQGASHASSALLFKVDTSEKFRIDSSGRLLVGTTASRSANSAQGSFQIEGTGAEDSDMSIIRNQANSGGPAIVLGKSRNASLAGNTVVQDGDQLGTIVFVGNDGTDLTSQGARIDAHVDGSPGSDDMPGRLTFSTTADGADSPSERLRIASNGQIFVANEAGTIDTTVRLGEGTRFQLSGLSSNDGFSVVRYSTGYGAWGYNLGRSKSGTLGTNTILADNDDIGHITFWGADGSDFNKAAQISAEVDGTPSDGTDMPGALVLKTSAEASGTPTERLRITSAGRFRIKSPDSTTGLQQGRLEWWNENDAGIMAMIGVDRTAGPKAPADLVFYTSDDVDSAANSSEGDRSEKMRINSTGEVKITGGTTSRALKVNCTHTSGGELVCFDNGVNNHYGALVVSAGEIDRECRLEAAYGNSLMTFWTQDSAAYERMRITPAGNVTTCGESSFDRTTAGVTLRKADALNTTRTNGCPFEVNRQGGDGALVIFYESNSSEGTINVSGSSVSYNGGVLSRWSQLVGISTNVKSDRPTIYRGTVMSNLDEMCEWTGEDNQQLNKTKVSTASGDKDVAGVFWGWDDDDDTYTNDFYIAQTGDFIVRVAGSTTVARGDLLESAGDGTAKPQSDDIVRSKTIAKIISTTSTATYADGSKAYPCVLMAC